MKVTGERKSVKCEVTKKVFVIKPAFSYGHFKATGPKFKILVLKCAYCYIECITATCTIPYRK